MAKMNERLSKEAGCNITPMQKQQLVLFIVQNRDALFSRKKCDGSAKANLWKHLSLKLNSSGSIKDADGWKRCYIGIKAATKARFRRFQKQMDSSLALLRLNEVESMILKMCDVETTGPTCEDSTTIFNLESGTSTMHDETFDRSSNNFRTVRMESPLLQGNRQRKDVATSTITSGAYELGEASNHNSDSTRQNTTTSSVLQQQDSVEMTENRFLIFPEDQTEQSSENLEPVPIREIHPSSNQEQGNVCRNFLLDVATVQIDAPRPPQQRLQTNESQKEKLVEFVWENYSALFGRISTHLNSELLKSKLWCLITNKLNEMGSHKNIQGWKDYFSTLKGQTKEKLTLIRQHQHRIGAVCPPENVHLSEMDDRIIQMFKLEILDGSSVLTEIGVSHSSNQNTNSTALSRPIRTISTERDDTYVTTAVSPQRSSSQEILQSSSSQSQPSNRIYPQNSRKRPLTNSEPQTQKKQNQNQPKRIRMQLQLPQSQPTLLRIYSTQDQPSQDQPLQNQPLQNQLLQNQPLQNQPPPDPPPQNQPPHLQLSDDEIRIIQEPRSQRRGVEVNLNRYVEPRRHRQNNDVDGDEAPRSPRRCRLSVPLGVMATESLQLQRTNNALLTDLLHELRTTNRH